MKHNSPPSPKVIAKLLADYQRASQTKKMSFKRYLASIKFVDRAAHVHGMDDSVRVHPESVDGERIELPTRPITGTLHAKVLLVDFLDRRGRKPRGHYEHLLFSSGEHPSGSMRDYYNEISRGKVKLNGTVDGWFRMPEKYSFYLGSEAVLAEHAVNAALEHGVTFPKHLDKTKDGTITGLVIVHAGLGAEAITEQNVADNEIYSHKNLINNPVRVARGLSATSYVVVPHNCLLGVCAHEFGHLAFQWDDFYDPEQATPSTDWDGSGEWDLMAGGMWNGGGRRPAHPAALHKIQHGWVPYTVITKSCRLTIKPITSPGGRVYKLVSPFYKKTQYLLLENRRRVGFDKSLPGDGLLVWRIDENNHQKNPKRPALQLVQADDMRNLETQTDFNSGDRGDPFPGRSRRTSLSDRGKTSTSFPKGERSGIFLENIAVERTTGNVIVDVRMNF